MCKIFTVHLHKNCNEEFYVVTCLTITIKFIKLLFFFIYILKCELCYTWLSSAYLYISIINTWVIYFIFIVYLYIPKKKIQNRCSFISNWLFWYLNIFVVSRWISIASSSSYLCWGQWKTININKLKILFARIINLIISIKIVAQQFLSKNIYKNAYSY